MPEITWRRPSTAEADTGREVIEVGFGDDGLVYLREATRPETVAVTTHAKWEAFVKGVKAGEFDHFVAGVADEQR
ncbi:conserved protein of unknown function [Streptantibioticus cattleyicolor NRRL 8057 = DSM 46488]|nr:conserved protein of unknown function [Streptantibioticus cattleyicolor NRRL 8057 = DSM 46488]